MAGEVLTNSLSMDREGSYHIRSACDSSVSVVRTKGAFDPRQTGSILLCWEKYFDLLL